MFSSSVLGITTSRASRRVDPPAGLERGLEHVAVGRQGDRDPGPLEEARRQDVDPERLGVELRDQPLGGQVGEADADDVAVALVRDVEHGQAGDDRARSKSGWVSTISRPITFGSIPAPE